MFTSFMGLGSMAISQTEFNKARHGDAYYIAASPPFRSRACWLALNVEGGWDESVEEGQAQCQEKLCYQNRYPYNQVG